MILILSDMTDMTTSIVVNWLNYYSAKYLRLNSFDYEKYEFTYDINASHKKSSIVINNQKYALDDFNVIWFRRFHASPNLYFTKNATFRFQEDVKKFVAQEKLSLLSLLSIELSQKYWLNHPSQGRLNKMLQLQIATHCGLNIPETIVTSSKQELLLFKQEYKKIITKPIQETTSFVFGRKSYTIFTKYVSDADIEELPDYFMHSQFQRKIEKEFEIRTFYLDGKFYSMAMFTQKDNKTLIDFRNYNFKNPARRVPFILPNEIEYKLAEFMKMMQINCGSFDLIKSTDGEYIFLELNPVGQFGMTSTPCNYSLEKEVALHLINKNKEYE